MNKLLTGALAASGLMMISACSDTFDPSSDREGRILPVVEVNKAVAAPKSEAAAKSRATGQAKEISADDLRLRLTADDGSFSQEWAGVSAFDNSADFSVGTYKFEAYYGAEGDEGFDKPYYYGSTSVRVLENQTTPVNVTASLNNAMVSVVYTDNVLEFFNTLEGEVVATGGTHAYPASENRPVYVTPGHIDVNVNVTKQNGLKAKLNAASFEAAPRNHYRVTVDVNGGTGVLDIKFESELEEEDVYLDISDAAFNAPAPVLTATGFTSGTPVTLVEGTPAPEKLRISATAQSTLKTAVLTTSSMALKALGWPETVDFATVDANTLQTLRNLGLEFPGLTGTMSKMAVVDFTKVTEHIAFIEGGNNTSEFTLVVKDAYSKVSEPVTLTVNVEKLSLEVANVEPLMQEETQMLVDVDFNGGDPAANLTVQLKNDRGMWEATTIEKVEAISRAGGRYRLTVTVPAAENPVYFRIVCGKEVTPEKEIVRAGAPIAVNDNDVFATHATFSVTGENAAGYARNAKVYLSTNGSDFTEVAPSAVDGAAISLASLTPATDYFVKIYANEGYSRVVKFTTEAAIQLPNAGMDEWNGSQVGDYQTLWYAGQGAGSPWCTMNDKTTSTRGSGSGIFSYGGSAYRATSGTMPANAKIGKSPDAAAYSDRQHGGSNAALIRTVGWGKDNTAAANLNGKCEHITAGELFLGSVDAQFNAVRGYQHTSRPKSLSFYAKYSTVKAGNGDFGVAEIRLLDASRQVIAQGGECHIAESGDYVQYKLDVVYPAGAAKAAFIEVNFYSSGNPSALSKNKNFLSDPGFGNYTDGEYVGSQLYVDDITLEY